MATIICQGGPAPRLFNSIIIDFICEKELKPTVDSIARNDIKSILKKIETAETSTTELTNEEDRLLEEINEIGWYKPVDMSSFFEFSNKLAFYYCYVKVAAYILEFVKGLDALNLVEIIKRHRKANERNYVL